MTDHEIEVIKSIKDNIEKESSKISFNITSESKIHYEEYAKRVIELIGNDNMTYDVDMENRIINFHYN